MLNPAPIIGATLAVFAIAFGGLTFRLASGHDPALATSATVQQTSARGAGAQGTTLRTHASGSRAGTAPPAAGRTAGSHAQIVTTASGRRGGARGGDA